MPIGDNVPSTIWSIIECFVGVICASAPSLKPLFSSASRKVNSSIPLFEGNNLGTGRANAKDLEGRQWDNNVKISGNCPNAAHHHNNGSSGSPADGVKSLVRQNPPASHDDKPFAVYTKQDCLC